MSFKLEEATSLDETARLTKLHTADRICLIIYFVYPIFKDTLGSFQVVWLLSVIAGGIFIVRNFRLTNRYGVIDIIWLLFGAAAVLAFATNPPGAAMGLQALITYITTVLMFLTAFFSLESLSWVLNTVKLMLLPHALATLVFMLVPSLYLQTVHRWFFSGVIDATGYQSGLTSHYSFNGMLLVSGFLISAAMLLTETMKTVEGVNGIFKAKNLIFVITYATAVVASAKRGSFIFGLLAISLVFLMANRGGKVPNFVILIFALSIALAVLFLLEQFVPQIGGLFSRLAERSSGDVNDITNNRIYLWNEAIRLWHQAPIFGHGVGTYRYHWNELETTIYAHNVYLGLLAETGIVGLIAFVFALVVPLIETLGSLKSASILNRKQAASLIFASMYFIYFAAYSFTGAPNYDIENYAFLLLLALPAWRSYRFLQEAKGR